MQQGLLACVWARLRFSGGGVLRVCSGAAVQGHLACNKLCERSHVVDKTKNYAGIGGMCMRGALRIPRWAARCGEEGVQRRRGGM